MITIIAAIGACEKGARTDTALGCLSDISTHEAAEFRNIIVITGKGLNTADPRWPLLEEISAPIPMKLLALQLLK